MWMHRGIFEQCDCTAFPGGLQTGASDAGTAVIDAACRDPSRDEPVGD
jgi:hypothetical protein